MLALTIAAVAYGACLALFFCAALLIEWSGAPGHIDWGDVLKGGFIAGTGFFVMGGILVGAVAIIINLTIGA